MSYIKQISEEKDVALSALCDSLQISRATLYRNNNDNSPNAVNQSRNPHNALSHKQKQKILDLLHSEQFVDCTPYDVYYTLLDEGKYIAYPNDVSCIV